jgi:hypothetical protein
MKRPWEISLLVYNFLFFTARHEVHKNSKFPYESRRFIMDKTELRRTFDTVSKTFITDFRVFLNVKENSEKGFFKKMCHLYALSFCHSTLPPLRK